MPAKKKRILVVAADGGVARFFETSRIGGDLTELEARRLKAPPTPAVSRPTRVHESMGPARHSVESRLSPKAATEAKFLAQVAAAIETDIASFDEVVLCAPPRALGILREHVSATVRERLRAEFSKDYVRETPERISALLAEGLS